MADGKRMSITAFERQHRKAKEEIRLMKTIGLDLLAATAIAEASVDALYEGVMGKEAPDLREVSA